MPRCLCSAPDASVSPFSLSPAGQSPALSRHPGFLRGSWPPATGLLLLSQSCCFMSFLIINFCRFPMYLSFTAEPEPYSSLSLSARSSAAASQKSEHQVFKALSTTLCPWVPYAFSLVILRPGRIGSNFREWCLNPSSAVVCV